MVSKFLGQLFECQRRIGAAEAKRIRQGDIHFPLLSRMRHQIHSDVILRIIQVERWGTDLIADREDGEYRLHRTRRAQQVANGGFG